MTRIGACDRLALAILDTPLWIQFAMTATVIAIVIAGVRLVEQEAEKAKAKAASWDEEPDPAALER